MLPFHVQAKLKHQPKANVLMSQEMLKANYTIAVQEYTTLYTVVYKNKTF